MLWVIHILVGIIIGLGFKSPMLIIPLAILSHFILDSIPHWDGVFDKKEFKETGIAYISKTDVLVKLTDILLSSVLIAFFYSETDSGKVLLGAFASILPDIAKLGYLTRLRKKEKYMSYLHFHSNIQKDAPLEKGLFIQFCFFLVFVAIIWYLI